MIRVLIINSSLERSGLTNVIYNLVKYIDYTQFELHILTLSEEPEFSRLKEFSKFPIHFHELNLIGVKRYIGLSKSVQPIIEKVAPDLIHTFAFRGVLAAASLSKKYKVVSTIQADLEKNYKADYGFWAGKIMAQLELYWLKKMSIRTVCSSSLIDLYKHIGELKYIPNGVCTEDYFFATKSEKVRYKKELKLERFRKVFISTGILNDRKNPICVINAFKKISDGTMALLIVGDGELMDACKAAIGGDVNIFLLGKKADVRPYLAASEVFISASWSEGLPNASLEAGFMGLTLVLSDILPHREIASEASAGVILFEPGNAEELAKILSKKEHESAQLDKKFEAKNMSNSFQELYVKMVSFN
ncbi:MAG: glycosyltransferase family 4 protein [Bacteroidia bacterium]|nr:glycosyltransferase family 4 protein [Bacteroidia bacterium]